MISKFASLKFMACWLFRNYFQASDNSRNDWISFIFEIKAQFESFIKSKKYNAICERILKKISSKSAISFTLISQNSSIDPNPWLLIQNKTLENHEPLYVVRISSSSMRSNNKHPEHIPYSIRLCVDNTNATFIEFQTRRQLFKRNYFHLKHSVATLSSLQLLRQIRLIVESLWFKFSPDTQKRSKGAGRIHVEGTPIWKQ